MSRGRGVTLVEATVGLALGLLVLAAATTAWLGARRAVVATDAALSREQTARVVLGRLADDLRAAGLGIDPDGDRSRPDEAVEAAWIDALALRADFDHGGPDATSPEAALAASGPFETVSTGNDEIVIWALQLPSGGESLVFEADVAGLARDGVVERVTIGRVPPASVAAGATLYRITLDTAIADPAAPGFLDRVPVADGVVGVGFEYLDGVGGRVAAPGGLDAGTAARRSIRAVRIRLELAGSVHVAEVALANADSPPPALR